jgi:hypothetical protein
MPAFKFRFKIRALTAILKKMAEDAENSNLKNLKIQKWRAVFILQDGGWRHPVWVLNIN